jgi:hypothetical protein
MKCSVVLAADGPLPSSLEFSSLIHAFFKPLLFGAVRFTGLSGGINVRSLGVPGVAAVLHVPGSLLRGVVGGEIRLARAIVSGGRCGGGVIRLEGEGGEGGFSDVVTAAAAALPGEPGLSFLPSLSALEMSAAFHRA